MTERRSRIEIVYDMLRAIVDKGGSIKPTHLLYKSNLSYKRLQEYVKELKVKDLVRESSDRGKTMFVLTEKGFQFLNDLKQLKQFQEAFGF